VVEVRVDVVTVVVVLDVAVVDEKVAVVLALHFPHVTGQRSTTAGIAKQNCANPSHLGESGTPLHSAEHAISLLGTGSCG
jgi:hypothetical protein